MKVSVYSFSYKKGIPVDVSGNGGGFVFDCRAIENPGKLDEYKPLTGKDSRVIAFLEQQPETSIFFDQVKTLVSMSVERYLSRDFNNLMVCFGCTGGRHRSVYFAERLAKYLKDKYNITVELTHNEKESW